MNWTVFAVQLGVAGIAGILHNRQWIDPIRFDHRPIF
jgi:hypothetical protein